jgi:hypothetical protein
MFKRSIPNLRSLVAAALILANVAAVNAQEVVVQISGKQILDELTREVKVGSDNASTLEDRYTAAAQMSTLIHHPDFLREFQQYDGVVTAYRQIYNTMVDRLQKDTREQQQNHTTTGNHLVKAALIHADDQREYNEAVAKLQQKHVDVGRRLNTISENLKQTRPIEGVEALNPAIVGLEWLESSSRLPSGRRYKPNDSVPCYLVIFNHNASSALGGKVHYKLTGGAKINGSPEGDLAFDDVGKLSPRIVPFMLDVGVKDFTYSLRLVQKGETK